MVDEKNAKLEIFFKEKREEARKCWALRGTQEHARIVNETIDEVENEIRKKRK